MSRFERLISGDAENASLMISVCMIGYIEQAFKFRFTEEQAEQLLYNISEDVEEWLCDEEVVQS